MKRHIFHKIHRFIIQAGVQFVDVDVQTDTKLTIFLIVMNGNCFSFGSAPLSMFPKQTILNCHAALSLQCFNSDKVR